MISSGAASSVLAVRRIFRLRPKLATTLTGVLLSLMTLAVLDRLFPPPLERAVSGSMLITDRAGIPLRAFPTEEGRWRLPAELDAIDPAFIDALIGVEDARFYRHIGVDGLAIIRAAKSAVQRGRIVSGASTITMQTARLLEPRPRTLPSKFIEMLRAVQLEMRVSKDEILELYLTLTPYGGNLEGIRAASWAYFGREPDRLSDDQIALLIALPQSPEVRRPDLRPESAKAARAKILDRLVELEVISTRRAEDAKALDLPGRHAFPAQAWHASAQVRDAYLARRKLRELPRDLRTSLDAGLQSALERYFEDMAETVGNGVQYSALVVEIETRKIRAHVGSASRKRPGGWIDLTRSARSPGSTLKPFIYGLAFDDGQALPNTFIEDLPARFNTYRPENFDRMFRGQVRVSDALQHSLNVPAVLALERIGPERFAAALTLSDVKVQIHQGADREAGLALALGGAGLTVQDLTKLYAGLGDDGVVKPLSWLETPEDGTSVDAPGHRFMSAESAEKIVKILKSAPTPGGRMPARLTKDAPEIAFKTGTSYGFRDAWAAGVARGYAVVVWSGRADGAPRPGETGRKSALPLLFTVFDKVHATLGAQGRASDRLISEKKQNPHFAMVDFDGNDQPPVILFPPDDAVLLKKRADHENPGFVLSGRGEGELRWFVGGKPVPLDAAGAPVWVPEGPGFYALSAVDGNGRETKVKVRVSDLTN